MNFPDRPQSPIVVVEDTFTAADGTLVPPHVATPGGAWSLGPGGSAASIQSNNASTPQAQEAYCYLDAGTKDCIVEGTITLVNTTDGISALIGCRSDGGSIAGVLLGVYNQSWVLQAGSPGTAPPYIYYSLDLPLDTNPHTLKLVCRGNLVVAVVDGTEVASVDVTDIPAPGTMCFFDLQCQNNDYRVTLDGFKVSAFRG